MFDTILWACDGSRRDDEAISHVRDLCDRHGSLLRIVHVAGPDDSPQGGPAAQRVIDTLKARSTALRDQGVRASLHVIRGATGSPAWHILQTMAAVAPDLLVVTAPGRRSTPSPSTVTTQLVAAACCPVLVICGSTGMSPGGCGGGTAATGTAITPA